MRLLQEYLSVQSDQRPNAIAVAMNGTQWSFAELDQFSNRLARALVESGAKRGDRVALLIGKSPLATAGIFGALKADCIYVPIDSHGPPDRVAKILQSSAPALVLADSSYRGLLQAVVKLCPSLRWRAGWLANCVPPESVKTAFTLGDLERLSARELSYRNEPRDGAYILFTSGSTGAPKGVLISHANVTAFVEWATQYFRLTPDDVISGHTNLHFDLSVFDLFGAIAAGAQLQLVPNELSLSPSGLGAFIRDRALTQWFSVPSVLTYLAKSGVVRHGDFPQLRRAVWCGEVLATATLRYWMERLPHVQFTNLYGPTEATVASSYYTVPRIPLSDDVIMPIGKACEGEQLLVLDSRLNPVGTERSGELFIKGSGLSPGYWGEPEKTRAAFLSEPGSGERMYRTGDLAKVGADGLVYFLGRMDSQIKCKGYRIELGEIEAALNAMDSLCESAVVATGTLFDGAVICCSFVPVDGATVTPANVRTYLSRKLPSYMLPSQWLELKKLPRNANGKVDRNRLKEMFEPHPASASQ